MNLEQVTQQLAIAHQRGDLEEVAQALVRSATVLVQLNRFTEACAAIEEATGLYHQLQNALAEARSSQLAANLYRVIGEFSKAQERAESALSLVEPGSSIAISATIELGEIAFATGQMCLAVNYYTQALKQGAVAGLLPRSQARLLHKQACALSQVGYFYDAIQALQQALELVQKSEISALAVRISDRAGFCIANDWQLA